MSQKVVQAECIHWEGGVLPTGTTLKPCSSVMLSGAGALGEEFGFDEVMNVPPL